MTIKISQAPHEINWNDLTWRLTTTISLISAYGFKLKDDYCFEHIEPNAVELQFWKDDQLYVARIEPNKCLIIHANLGKAVSSIDHSGVDSSDWIQCLAYCLADVNRQITQNSRD